jgi:putative DNA primase/helicase
MTVRRWQNVFYVWDGRQYAEVIDEDIRAKIYRLFADQHVELPGRVSVDNTLDALRALSNVSSHTSMPSWLRASAPVPASEITAVRNGLLHIPTRELLEHDARFFNGGAVDVVYDTGAPAPMLWLKFLADAFPGDQESIDAMQQWFGYLLTSDTSQQKALICVGPKRCGKGTIGRVLKALLGDANYCGPTLNQLGRPFGTQTLIGKTLALVSDARVSGQADLQAIGEAILNITGEDAINVGRKGLPDWVGKLTTRFVLLTNILPGIVDSGGAVGSRFVVLKFTQSFFGREDPQLTSKLMKELPGILNWALDGLAGLLARGAFIQPATGLAAVDELKRKTTPLLGFIEDELIFSSDDEAYVAKDTVYARYKTWCGEEGMKFVAQKNNFFSELYSTSDGRLVQYRPHATDGGRISAVKGARLRAHPNPQETADRGANAKEFR